LAAARARLAQAGVDSLAIDVDQQIVLMDRAAFKGKKITPESILDSFEKDARAINGIARIDRFANLARDTAKDPVARRWSHQFPANTNVEMVATLTPGSLWGTLLVASHGSPYDYDSNVPIIFYGPGIARARRTEFVRTVDIAPTLAQLLGVKPLEKLDGIPLRLK
jgi:predicted AlkP superfamily pyrophosphatase or phosphodiesterase